MAKKRTMRGFNTRALHAEIPYLHPLAHVMPVYRTSTFVSESLDVPIDPEFPCKYARIGHPNGFLLEHTLASLEEGEAAVVAADGMRAISAACMSFIRDCYGKSIIATAPLYSETYAFFMQRMPLYGRECFFLDARATPEEQFLHYIARSYSEFLEEKIHPIEFFFIETPANPTLTVYDIKKLCEIAHEHKIPVIVDSTFASPYNQRPLSLGADLVIHSLTKYCCGNGAALGGAVIGSRERIDKIRAIVRCEGGHLPPDPAWIIQIGLETLGIRIPVQNRNAMTIARFLSSYGKELIPVVHYPGLASHPQHEIAKAQMRIPDGKPGFGGMVSFELCHRECTAIFADALAKTLAELAVSLGSTKTTFAIPARQIHSGLSASERAVLGISDTLIRMSVGAEEARDIKRALSSALRFVARACVARQKNVSF